jgi:predicted neutral ceramidase superfamily lipid hydrolase
MKTTISEKTISNKPLAIELTLHSVAKKITNTIENINNFRLRNPHLCLFCSFIIVSLLILAAPAVLHFSPSAGKLLILFLFFATAVWTFLFIAVIQKLMPQNNVRK